MKGAHFIIPTPVRLKRTAPEEATYWIAFFASPAAGYIRGQTLFVCGGLSVGF